MRLVLAGVLVSALAVPSTVHAGACAPPSISSAILTPDAATLDQHGGIVIGQGRGYDEVSTEKLDKLPWKLDGKAFVPTILAPGLAVLTVPAGKHTIVDSKGKKLVTVSGTRVPDRDQKVVVPTPMVHSVTYTSFSSPRGSSAATSVQFAGTIPTSVLAAIAMKDGKPISWGRVENGGATLFSSGRCQVQATGSGPFTGDKVTLVFVDKLGHRSLASSEITVK